MRAYQLKKSGKPEVLQQVHIAEPVPSTGEVKVELHFIGLNYAEILSRKGLYEWAPQRPYTPGMEGSGIITAVGPGVDEKRLGERVMVGTQFGCYAEAVAVPEQRALSAIEHFTMAENAAFAVNYMTAWISLFELARVRREDTVLITAAAGGVGTAAVQLATALGCRVYGLAGSEAKIKQIEQLGARKGFNYRKKDWPQQVRSECGGVDVVLEMVGGVIHRENMQLLNPFGRSVVCGFASLDLNKWSPLSWWRTWRDIPRAGIVDLATGSRGILATHLGYLLDDPPRMKSLFEDLCAFTIEHNIRPVIGRRFTFGELTAAHAFIESRKSTGKVLLSLDRSDS